MQQKLVVIGGGAAGFFCAVNAARLRPDLKVVILEKSNKLLSKVRISGGGRCNVTHACFDITEMSKRYPRGQHFVKKTFHKFFTTDTIDWFRQRGVPLKTEADGRMFPASDNSQAIINCLINEAALYGVHIITQAEVKSVENTAERFSIKLATHTLDADFLCIASGGFPKLSMFNWMGPLGHTIEPPVPSLFTFNIPNHPIAALMGVSVPQAVVKIHGSKLTASGPLLITHWGLSGPAVLKLSAWGALELNQKNYTFNILINWLGTESEDVIRDRFINLRTGSGAQKLYSRNNFGLPARLWEFLLSQSGVAESATWGNLNLKDQNKLIKNLTAFEAAVNGKTTFKEEFVTAGGIRLTEVDPQTMMSRKHKNLFFAGEILNVDGITGGYNFQHAWTSGFIAAQAIAGDAS